jgi:hypothetical protein
VLCKSLRCFKVDEATTSTENWFTRWIQSNRKHELVHASQSEFWDATNTLTSPGMYKRKHY